MGHPHRESEPEARRQNRCRHCGNRAEHRRADRGPSVHCAARAEGSLVGEPQRHQVGRRGVVRRRHPHDGDPGRVRPPVGLAERVLPAEVLAREVSEDDAVRELTLRAATALGVATEADIRDYFRLAAGQAKPAIAKLVADGELERVDVDGWSNPAYLVAGQTIPRRDRGTALLCPFDPLIFFRPRVERLFGFHYRIEIYTPASKRQYGYYVWPFLLDGELVGRVDLKADRAANALQVVGAFVEDGRPPSRVAEALAGELQTMAGWLGLAGVAVGNRGNLADALRATVARLAKASHPR